MNVTTTTTTAMEFGEWLDELGRLAADDPEEAWDRLQQAPAMLLITTAHAISRSDDLDHELVTLMRVLLLDRRIALTPDAIPDRLFDAWIDQLSAERPPWPRCLRQALLDWLSRHPHIPRRVQTAQMIDELASVDPDLVDSVARRLVEDGIPLVHRTAEATLPSLLAQAPGCKQSEMTASWAVSPSIAQRAAIAHAIARGLTTVGVPSVLEHLSSDDHPWVRRNAVEAASARAQDFPRRARHILDRAAHDRDPEIRRTAMRGRALEPGRRPPYSLPDS